VVNKNKKRRRKKEQICDADDDACWCVSSGDVQWGLIIIFKVYLHKQQIRLQVMMYTHIYVYIILYNMHKDLQETQKW
jgi:hypothetical protein